MIHLSYKKEDFILSDGIRILSVKTVIEKANSLTKTDLENFLITHWEKKTLNYKTTTPITYNRINHIEFKYKIKLQNENRTKRKVIFRIWLGLLESTTKISS